jgi:hypothetical protein
MTMLSRRRALLHAAFGVPLVLRTAFAAEGGGRVLRVGPDDYRPLLRTLRPGDTLRLAAGEYRQGLPVHGLKGEAAAPITIEGPRGGAAVFVARPRHNTVSIVDSAHVRIRDLTLAGRNQPVDAVKAEGHARFAHHIVLQRLRIAGHGLAQSLVGVSTKCPAWGWQILDNVISGAGTGMYLGQSDGSAPFWDGLIAGNRIVDPIGYGIQIKHQLARPALDEAPTDRALTVIRGNVIVKSRGASTVERARPNLLLGHFPLHGDGSDDLYLVHGNLLYDNPSEALLQAEGRLRLYNNLLVNPHGDALRLIAHNDRPRDVAVFFNTVVASRVGIEVAPAQDGDLHRVLRNVLAAEHNPGVAADGANQFVSFADAGAELVRPAAALKDLDLAPRRARAAAAPLPGDLAALPGAAADYLGRRRQSAIFGACLPAAPGTAACR